MNHQSNPRKRECGLSMSTKRTEFERLPTGYSAKRTPLALAKNVSGAQYLLAKGPDGTRGFYSRSHKLNAMAHEFIPMSN